MYMNHPGEKGCFRAKNGKSGNQPFRKQESEMTAALSIVHVIFEKKIKFPKYLSGHAKNPKRSCKNRKRYLFMNMSRQIFWKLYSLFNNHIHVDDGQGSSLQSSHFPAYETVDFLVFCFFL